MTLRPVPDDPTGAEPRPLKPGPRQLAPRAPTSEGPLPLDLARHLHLGEAVIWWGRKDAFDHRALALVIGVLLAVLAAVTAFVPEFWSQPLAALWKPLAALASPLALVVARERANLRATVITDTSIIDVPQHGRADRIAFDNVRRVRRDLVRGGVRLEGVRHRVRIAPSLMEGARAAIESQRSGQFRPITGEVDDPLHWLP